MNAVVIDGPLGRPREAAINADGRAAVIFVRHGCSHKTTNYGKSWTAITTGVPEGSYVHAVREDPKRKGLLYAHFRERPV